MADPLIWTHLEELKEDMYCTYCVALNAVDVQRLKKYTQILIPVQIQMENLHDFGTLTIVVRSISG